MENVILQANLISQEFELFDYKDYITWVNVTNKNYSGLFLNITKWAPNQSLNLKKVYFSNPPSFLESINPFDWVKNFKKQNTKPEVNAFYEIEHPFFSKKSQEFQRVPSTFVFHNVIYFNLSKVLNEIDGYENSDVDPYYNWDDRLQITLSNDYTFFEIQYTNLSVIIADIGGIHAALAALFGVLFTGIFKKQLDRKMKIKMIDQVKRDGESEEEFQ